MSIEQTTINTIRTLAIDAIQQANSGHPGAPMGMAPIAYSLWRHHLKFNPDNPYWPNRDRFILSAGHASMLLYSMLHLTRTMDPDNGHEGELSVSMKELQSFRQLGSRCPGHPEFGETPGVETTTGPLGQGLAVSVGVAMGERWLAARYNTEDFTVFDFNVYALCGDGCMMEGVSHEAAAMAGHLKLGNLVWIYDSNRITIEGSTDLAMSEDIARRFIAYGWSVMTVKDGNDLAALKQAMDDAAAVTDRPVLLIVNTEIAWGSPNKQGSESAHGAPLGADEVKLTKEAYEWPVNSDFLVPEEVYTHFEDEFGIRNRIAEVAWNELFQVYQEKHPENAHELEHIFNGTLPENWQASLPQFSHTDKPVATRSVSGTVLNAVASAIPWIIGGSADLGPSNKSLLSGEADFSAEDYSGRNIRFGVREFGMTAICNGLANTGLIPYSSTFLVFSDYSRPAIRLAALMQLPVLYVYTHDSISVGEDGPTHQPVEHLASLRAIPGLTVFRPADAAEVAAGYRYALEDAQGPVLLSLSRQNLPIIDRDKYADAAGALCGAYALADSCPGEDPDIIIIATGSEVRHAMAVYEKLADEGVNLRVVSMPSWELFDSQPETFQEEILPSEVTKRVVMEQGVSLGWHKYAGAEGVLMTLDRFGASAPGPEIEKHFGFTADDLEEVVREMLS